MLHSSRDLSPARSVGAIGCLDMVWFQLNISFKKKFLGFVLSADKNLLDVLVVSA